MGGGRTIAALIPRTDRVSPTVLGLSNGAAKSNAVSDPGRGPAG